MLTDAVEDVDEVPYSQDIFPSLVPYFFGGWGLRGSEPRAFLLNYILSPFFCEIGSH